MYPSTLREEELKNKVADDVFGDCDGTRILGAFDCARILAVFPPNANIIVVGPETTVPQPHKTVVIQTGQYEDPTTGAASFRHPDLA